ncbi:hypothetical protein RchiOBHm_Chr1g0346961 [Rosa chinensis]|uniref:Uncharacterized protein n=1 Tax=Rosa chinensis TaxID=74649 RepID=A0A2P6SF73_ROSCH|nr:hypothetical protein RchiOBHm_Chr1g0346961 [Rosa chinensis]
MVTPSFLSNFKYSDNLTGETKTKKINRIETNRDLSFFKSGTVVLLISLPVAEFRLPNGCAYCHLVL